MPPVNRRLRLTVVNKNIQTGDFFIHLFFHGEIYVEMSVVDAVIKQSSVMFSVKQTKRIVNIASVK